MLETWMIIAAHQLIFQGMFVFKNMMLYRKTGEPIRGRNIEATLAIALIVVFIGVALALSVLESPVGKLNLLNPVFATLTGIALLCLNLVISLAALIHIKDSWRVGVLEDQQTDLVTTASMHGRAIPILSRTYSCSPPIRFCCRMSFCWVLQSWVAALFIA